MPGFKMNMQGCLLLLFLSFSAPLALAQSYSISPDDTVEVLGTMEDLHILGIRQNNHSQDTLRMKWRKLSATCPDKWDAAVCDNVFCNTVLADSGTMNPVAPSDSAFLEMHLTPKINYGTAVIRYLVWDVTTPAQTDTLTYILHVNPLGTDPVITEKAVFIIQSSTIILSDPYRFKSFSLLDLSGRFLATGGADGIDISVYPAGIYILAITDHAQKIYFKKIFYEGS